MCLGRAGLEALLATAPCLHFFHQWRPILLSSMHVEARLAMYPNAP